MNEITEICKVEKWASYLRRKRKRDARKEERKPMDKGCENLVAQTPAV